MATFLVTLTVFGLVFAALALGLMLGREPIRGSCGGLRKLGLPQDCHCDSPCPRRRRELERQAAHATETPP